MNFRNLADETINFSDGINIFYGDNAQGKTNLLEAVYICSTGRSQRTRTESQLIKFGYDEAHIRTFVMRENSSDRIDVHIRKDERKGMALNGIPIRKMAEFFGNLTADFCDRVAVFFLLLLSATQNAKSGKPRNKPK